jgi:hypothetical protein
MTHFAWKPEQRRAFYDYIKDRKRQYRELVVTALGGRCHGCNALDSATDPLCIRFVDGTDPLKDRYRTNPVTLHRRLYFEPKLRGRVALFCNLCKLERNLSIDNSQ